MKKLITSLLVLGLVLTGVSVGNNVEAATGNSMKTVQQLNKGDKSLENVKIGESMKSVLKKYSHPIYSYNPNSNEKYYEFRTDKGVLLVTANGKKERGNVTRVSMTYNDANGPSYKAVKQQLGHKAISRVHIIMLQVTLAIFKKAKQVINSVQIHQKIKMWSYIV